MGPRSGTAFSWSWSAASASSSSASRSPKRRGISRDRALLAPGDERRVERAPPSGAVAPGRARGDGGARARIDAGRMASIEAEVRHDVIAFLSMIAESAGDDARHLHAGLTSSDLVDTALACQIGEAVRLLAAEVRGLRVAAHALAERHRRTAMVGRTHGIHAVPITFGHKCLAWS